jgi:arsenate reductase (glutaredoxin)
MGLREPVTLFEYAACGTCRKAKKWLEEHEIRFESVPIVEMPPTLAELTRLVKESRLPVQKWFNTSGESYRALVRRLGKEELARLGDSEKLRLLAADGKMIKRPVLVTGKSVLVGFDETAYGALAR